MTGIKTGNKGFINPADANKVYVMDPVPPGAPSVNDAPPDYDPGDLTVDNTVKDISSTTRITLGTYLSKLTRGEAGSSTTPNKYSIDPSTPASPVLQVTTNGYPTPPAISDNSQQFQQILPSNYSQDFVAVQQDIRKGRGPGDALDGNELLRTATPDLTSTQLSSDNPLSTYTAEVSSGNRWSSDSSTFTSGADPTAPPSEFNVPLLSAATAGFPSENVSSSSAYELDLATAVSKASVETADNTFPVVTTPGAPLGSTTAYDGYPAPLTPPPNQNSGPDGSFIHAPDLPATPSPAGMKKGKSPAADPDGHELLSTSFVEGPSGVTPPPAVKGYVTSETDRNEFDSASPLFPPEFDVTEPPATYEARIADTNEKGKYETADKVPVTLDRLRLKPSSDTLRNEYPVDDKLGDLQSLVDPATKLPETLVSTSNKASFIPREEIKPLSSDGNIKNFSKGKGAEPYDGNNLLPDISGNRSTSRGKSYESKGDLQYVVTGTPQTDETPSGHPILSPMAARGSTLNIGNNRFAPAFVPAEFNPEYTLKDGKKVKAMKFAQVGYALSQRASAEIPGFISSEGSKFDPTGDLAELGAILPSVNQLGILKVDDQLLSAEDALASLNDEDYPVDSLSQIAYFGGQSWGNMTNVSEPYDSDLNLGLLVTAIAMLLVIRLLIFLISIPATDQSFATRNDKGSLTKGNHLVEVPVGVFGVSIFPNIYDLFGISPTKNSFEDCLDYGFNAYFLNEITGDTFDVFKAAGLLIGKSAFSTNEHLYMPLVTCRTIVRSGILLAVAVSRIVNSPSITAGVRGFLNIMKVIRESKLVRSLNVFASLGDRVRESENRSIMVKNYYTGKEEAVSLEDALPVETVAGKKKILLHPSVRKSRLGNAGNYDPTLAWSSARAPALYLVSRNSKKLSDLDKQNTLGSFKGLSALKNSIKNGYQQQSSLSDNVNGNETGRIKGENRAAMERYLDGEYVPFYFHDVRTNEIVSFHAFLTSLNDDYTASYDSVEGLGRIEPVKIYKGTARKVGMSFYVAATNEEDFNHMWYKLNKLTTLVYPQYDKGKNLIGKGYNFKAPFSQKVAASPLIRIRLGELLRSNYSRFAMARLFGLTDGDANIRYAAGDSKEINTVPVFPSAESVKAESAADERKRITPEVGDTVVFRGDPAAAIFSIPGLNVQLDGDVFTPEKVIEGSKNGLKVLSNTDSNNNIEVEVDIGSGDMQRLANLVNQGILQLNVGGVSLSPPPGLKFKFKVSASLVNVAKKAPQNEPPTRATTSDQISLDAINSFVKPENNSIVKSFESAGGKGLAGFIESMNFDWFSANTWEITPGVVAPKICKVTISFSPIHDITPGLDHKGYNRAPIYPVGNAMRSAAVDTPDKA